MDLEARIDRLESIDAIRQLVAAYGIAMDERRMDEVRVMFTPGARLTSKDGVFSANGLQAIIDTYQGRWDVLGPTYHIVHGQTVDIDPNNPDRATGTVTSHAEVVRNDEPMLVALMYEDVYERHEGRWKFAHREMGYFYYMPPQNYVEVMQSANRNLAYGDARPADYPEALRSTA